MMKFSLFRCYLPAIRDHFTSQRNSIVGCMYSMYSPRFIEPIFQKDKLQELKESGEAKKLTHVPVKAARTQFSNSPYYDPEVEKFTHHVMRGGNKELATFLVNKTFETIKRIQVEKFNRTKDQEERAKIELDPLKIFHKAVDNCKPILGLTPVLRGGSTYQVPVGLTANRSRFLSMKWLIEQGKADSRTTRFYVKLANELINASNGQGKVIKRKQELHKQCEANRAYAHYRETLSFWIGAPVFSATDMEPQKPTFLEDQFSLITNLDFQYTTQFFAEVPLLLNSKFK